MSATSLATLFFRNRHLLALATVIVLVADPFAVSLEGNATTVEFPTVAASAVNVTVAV